MLSSFVYLLASATAALASTSPLCLLASTSDLPIEAADYQSNPLASHVYEVIYRSLASCPTKHYAVMIEPNTLSYTRLFVPETRNASSVFLAEDLDGQVNVNYVLNVILMDCLHHGVLHVKELDPTVDLPVLDREVIRQNVIYAVMPEVSVDMTRNEYTQVVRRRKDYVEQVIEKYFDGDDYTLIYIREREDQVRDVVPEHGDGKESPLIE